jgi:hypothetical protein
MAKASLPKDTTLGVVLPYKAKKTAQARASLKSARPQRVAAAAR